jgi:hypothetical protein
MSQKTTNPASLAASRVQGKFDCVSASNARKNTPSAPERQTLRLKSPPAAFPTGFKSREQVVTTSARQEAEKAFKPNPPKLKAAPSVRRPAIDTCADISADLAPAHRAPIKRDSFAGIADALVGLMETLPTEPGNSLSLRTTLAVAELLPEQPPWRVIAALNVFADDESKPQGERDKARTVSSAVRATVLGFRLVRFEAALRTAIEIVEATQ